MTKHARTTSSRRVTRPVAVMAVAALALAGCGSDDAGTSGDAAPVSETIAPESDDASEDAPDTAPPADTDDATADTDDATADTVTVTDATGEITVPVTSENVVALDEYTAVNLLALGVRPSTTFLFFQEDIVDAILEAEGIEPITGPPFAVNLETLSQTDASLIVGFSFPTILEVRDTIDDNIAPTVLAAGLSIDWRAQLALLASVTGTDERAVELERSVDAAIEELRADIAAAGLEGTVVSLLEEGPTGISLPETGRLAPSILEQVGLARPAVELVEGDGFVVNISEETLGDHDAEYMLVEVYGVEATLNDSPLRSADGVTAYVYGWGENVLGAFRIITDLRRILLDDAEPLGQDGQLEIWNEFLAP